MENAQTREYLPFQQRVLEEKVELESKIMKLTSFLEKVHPDLSTEDRHLLYIQLSAMKTYNLILAQRILRFS